MTLSNEKKLSINTAVALANKCVTVVCGLILPRFFIQAYGSEVNGLISSITTFLGMIALLDLGVGAVVQASLYKPLADKDYAQISRIVKSSSRFFRKVAIVLLAYVAVLAFAYPMLVDSGFGLVFEGSLVVILAIDSFANYFFAISYGLLLNADQKSYIPMGLSCICTAANFGACMGLITMGAPVHIVKLASAVVFLIKPVVMVLHVRKCYPLDRSIELDGEPIKQKWNGIAQHLAYYITINVDVLVLTAFSSLSSVSVYAVHNMVTAGMRDVVVMVQNGFSPYLGNLLSKNQFDKLRDAFAVYEWACHAITALLFSCTAALIVPFIDVYTDGIYDAEYHQPIFAMIIVIAQFAYCVRMPYNNLVIAAGHFKQTQTSSIVEMIINTTATLLLVHYYGLVGAAAGTLMALVYRTIYLALYIRNILPFYRIGGFVKLLMCDVIVFLCVIGAAGMLNMTETTFTAWAVLAAQVFVISVLATLSINIILCHKELKALLSLVRKS